jgi:hypothetical protein
VANVIEQNQKKKKKNLYPKFVRAMSTKEEIEKKIIEYLVVKKNDCRKLICINPQMESILIEVGENLTKVVYPNQMKYQMRLKNHKGN